MLRIGEEILSFKEKESFKNKGVGTSKEKQIINEEYEQEIKDMLRKKNLKDLVRLENEIHEALKAKEFTMDIEYWDLILKKLDFYKAKIKLNEFYLDFKSKNVEKTRINPEKYQASAKILNENENAIGPNSPFLIEFDEELDRMGLTLQEDDNLLDIQEERKKVLEAEIEKALNSLSKNLKKNRIDHAKTLPKPIENKNENDDLKNQPENLNKQIDEDNDRAVAEQIMNFEKTKPLKPNEEKFDDLVEIKKVVYKKY